MRGGDSDAAAGVAAAALLLPVARCKAEVVHLLGVGRDRGRHHRLENSVLVPFAFHRLWFGSCLAAKSHGIVECQELWLFSYRNPYNCG